ncbi:MAG: 5-(carboxyamino)imidazole ribonucleotide mutase [Armatimonadota bacterium]
MSEQQHVSIVMGSESDLEVMYNAANILDKFGILYEMRIISAHRTPDEAHKFSRSARGRGVKVIIAGAGKAAHLAGVIASLTTLPVIGIPMTTSDLGGLDSLLSTVQMPGGIPVATTAIGKAGAINAALLAVSILALSREDLVCKLEVYRQEMQKEVELADNELVSKGKFG